MHTLQHIKLSTKDRPVQFLVLDLSLVAGVDSLPQRGLHWSFVASWQTRQLGKRCGAWRFLMCWGGTLWNLQWCYRMWVLIVACCSWLIRSFAATFSSARCWSLNNGNGNCFQSWTWCWRGAVQHTQESFLILWWHRPTPFPPYQQIPWAHFCTSWLCILEDGSGDGSDEGEDSDSYDYEENDMQGGKDGDTDGYDEDGRG